MLIKRLTLSNFRNYSQATLELKPGINILIGENAQGKTNFLEAIELLSTGQSTRTSVESELIQHGKDKMHINIDFQARQNHESLGLSLFNQDEFFRSAAGKAKRRIVYVNGVTYALMKKLRGRLVTVGFNTYDLNLVRGGPSFRRDWIDSIIVRLKPTFYEHLSKYQKITQQRNKLLKSLYETSRLSSEHNAQLEAWDEQLALYGATIIHWRYKILQQVIEKARDYLSLISDQHESLSMLYRCRAVKVQDSAAPRALMENFFDQEVVDVSTGRATIFHDEREVAQILLYSLNKRRLEEVVRGQTLSGPHRDDIIFLLNKKEATAFASQGQQRSLVLALKLSELALIKENLLEPPVLLLDDVLAELDLKRQSLLMSQINNDMQTIISTTHVSSFDANWLDNAHFFQVKSGTIAVEESAIVNG